MAKSQTKKVLIALSIAVEVVAPNKLRKFIFGLQKTKDGGNDLWVIDFEILDRAKPTDQFARALKVDVDVTLKNEPLAVAVVERGLTLRQTRYLNNVVSAEQEALAAGEITQAQFAATVEKTLEKR